MGTTADTVLTIIENREKLLFSYISEGDSFTGVAIRV